MCEHGNTVPMPLNGRVRAIDSCLAVARNILALLEWAAVMKRGAK